MHQQWQQMALLVVSHKAPIFGICSNWRPPFNQQEILSLRPKTRAVLMLYDDYNSIPRWVPLLLSLFFPSVSMPLLFTSFLANFSSFFPSSLFPSCSLQIKALIIIIARIYQVLTRYQALGSALYIHHPICASQQPSEVEIVIIILTLQTSNWSQGRLSKLSNGIQVGSTEDPIQTDITSAVLFFHYSRLGTKGDNGETEIYVWKVLNIDFAEGWVFWKVLGCHMILLLSVIMFICIWGGYSHS